MIRELIDILIVREGGFVWHPDDRGGATKFGITQKALGRWRGLGRLASPAEVELLKRDEAEDIYLERYWKGPGFNELMIHPVLQEYILDAAVHHGPARAKRLLQEAVGTKVDGVIGPNTRHKVWDASPVEVGAQFMGVRASYIGRIITKRPSQAVFAHGWMRRLEELLRKLPHLK